MTSRADSLAKFSTGDVFHALRQTAPGAEHWEMMSIGKSVGAPEKPRPYDSLTREEKIELILVNFLIPRNRANDD